MSWNSPVGELRLIFLKPVATFFGEQVANLIRNLIDPKYRDINNTEKYNAVLYMLLYQQLKYNYPLQQATLQKISTLMAGSTTFREPTLQSVCRQISRKWVSQPFEIRKQLIDFNSIINTRDIQSVSSFLAAIHKL